MPSGSAHSGDSKPCSLRADGAIICPTITCALSGVTNNCLGHPRAMSGHVVRVDKDIRPRKQLFHGCRATM